MSLRFRFGHNAPNTRLERMMLVTISTELIVYWLPIIELRNEIAMPTFGVELHCGFMEGIRMDFCDLIFNDQTYRGAC